MDSPGAGTDAVFVLLAVAAIAFAGLRGVRAVREATERRALIAARVLTSGLLLAVVVTAAASMLIALVGSGRAAAFGPVEVARHFVVVLGQPEGLGLMTADIPDQLHRMYGPVLGLDVNSTLRVRLEPSFFDQVLAWGLFVTSVLAVAVPLELLRRIFTRAAAGEAFTRATVRLVDALAIVVGAGWLVVVFVQRILEGRILAHAGATHGFAWPSVTTQVLVGLALLALGRIWREALPEHERAPLAADGARAAAVPPPARP